MSKMLGIKSKSRLISLIVANFTRRDGKRNGLDSLQNIFIDSDLMKWGLLSGSYDQNSSGFWWNDRQMVVLLLEWGMMSKWLICIWFPHVNHLLMGDFTVYLPGSRIYYLVPFSLWTFIGAFSASFFYVSEGTKWLSWMKPLQICKRELRPDEVNLDAERAEDFWQRICFSSMIVKFVIRNSTIIAFFIFIYIFGFLWPRAHLFPTGIIWGMVSFAWFYHTIAIQFGLLAVFHSVCHYLIIRFSQVNQQAKQLELTQMINTNAYYEQIFNFMCQHNGICQLVHHYNIFWQFYVWLNFITYIPLMCFIIYLVLFCDMICFSRFILLVAAFIIFICLCIPSLSAGLVADQAHDSYEILNSISQKIIPLTLKTQLQIYIQRLGGPIIGFSCLSLFTVTFENFFQIILALGSFFLLIMDITQSEKITWDEN